MGEKQDFPAMIYHPVLKAKIVHSTEEKQKHVDDGWYSKPVPTVKQLEGKLIYHQEEVEKVKAELLKYTIKEPAKVPETKPEPMPEDPKPNTFGEAKKTLKKYFPPEDPKPKRRGRKKKNGTHND